MIKTSEEQEIKRLALEIRRKDRRLSPETCMKRAKRAYMLKQGLSNEAGI